MRRAFKVDPEAGRPLGSEYSSLCYHFGHAVVQTRYKPPELYLELDRITRLYAVVQGPSGHVSCAAPLLGSGAETEE